MSTGIKEAPTRLEPYFLPTTAPLSPNEEAKIYAVSLENWKESGEPPECIVFMGDQMPSAPWKKVFLGAAEQYRHMHETGLGEEANVIFAQVKDFKNRPNKARGY